MRFASEQLFGRRREGDQLNTSDRHTYPAALGVHRYHGAKRHEDEHRIFTSDIVLTTYAIVAAEIGRGTSVLSKVQWYRIILDEGEA
jgi:SWI/SNF-related matrix-associated actin-dependent regulator of chromatin subfamily A3